VAENSQQHLATLAIAVPAGLAADHRLVVADPELEQP
jgi:hypothetical protein